MRALPLLAALVLLADWPSMAAAPAGPSIGAPAGTPVALAARPGTPLDAIARQLMAQDIGESRRARDRPLVLTGSAPLGSASDRPALFIQLQSARDCGSAGCSTAIFLWQKGAWKRVLDGVDGKLTVSATRSHGMADLVSDKVRYVWNGQEYRDSRPSPAFNLRRRG